MAEPQRDGRHVDAGLEQVHRGSRGWNDMRRHARTVPVAYTRVDEYVDEVVDPTTGNGPDRIWSQMRGRTESVSSMVSGVGQRLTLGTRRDHAYYVKLAVAWMPATPGGNDARLTVTCHNAMLVILPGMTSWSYLAVPRARQHPSGGSAWRVRRSAAPAGACWTWS